MQKEISLKQIFDIIKSRIILVITVTVVAAVITALITSFFITPKYTSVIKFCLVADIENQETSSSSVERNNSLYAKEMMETCIGALDTGDAYSEINFQLKNIDNGYKDNEISSSNIDIAQIGTSNNFGVTVTTRDPKLSYDVCNAFEIMASSLIPKIGELRLEKIDSPILTEEPSSPNLVKNCILGALIGCVLSAAAVVIFALLDNTVKNGTEVSRQLNILLLAEIPDIFGEESSDYAYTSKSQHTDTRGKNRGR